MKIYNYRNRIDELTNKEELTFDEIDLILLRDCLRFVFEDGKYSSEERLIILTNIINRTHKGVLYSIEQIITIGLSLGIFRSPNDPYLKGVVVSSNKLLR